MKSNQKFEGKSRAVTITDLQEVEGQKLVLKRLRPPPHRHWRWLWLFLRRAALLVLEVSFALLRQRTLVRDVAPGRPPLAEHEWKPTDLKPGSGSGRFLA